MTKFARERLNIAVRIIAADGEGTMPIATAFDLAERILHEHIRRVGGNEPEWGTLGQLIPEEPSDGTDAAA